VIVLSSLTDYRIATDSISQYGATEYFNKNEIAKDKDKERFLKKVEVYLLNSSR
jgi:hypothetical protein